RGVSAAAPVGAPDCRPPTAKGMRAGSRSNRRGNSPHPWDMDQELRIARQTSTAAPLAGKFGRVAPPPASEQTEPIRWQGPARTRQWLLDGRAWSLPRPPVDFVLPCAAAMIALGGLSAPAHVTTSAAPLLALPPLVMAMMFVRGLYGRRLRAVVLDGIVPMV